MIGLGYRREMREWQMSKVEADFFEVLPENWLRRSPEPLIKLIESNRPVYLHGVSLNIGGYSDIPKEFLKSVKELMSQLNLPYYSDHLAASGDAHQLYDLFPIPFTLKEAKRVAGRISQIQEIIGKQFAVENSTWYTNTGEMTEAEFLMEIVNLADCKILLDINNIDVNYKNHGTDNIDEYINKINLSKVNYIHVAGHEYDDRFNMYIDTHSEPLEIQTIKKAKQLHQENNIPVLLEWDNDIPNAERINQELNLLK